MATNNALNAPLPLKSSKGGTGVANSDSFTFTYGGNVSLAASFTASSTVAFSGSVTIGGNFTTSSSFVASGSVNIGGALTTSTSAVNIGGGLTTSTSAVNIRGSLSTQSNAVTIGGTLTTSTGAVSFGGAYTTLNSHNWLGNFAFQATLTGATNITFPTSGTVISTATGMLTQNAFSEISTAGLQSAARTNLSAQAQNAYLDQLSAYEVNIGNNIIINGNFNVFQRSVSTTNPADGTFVADRWYYNKSGTGVVTISQDTANLPSVSLSGVASNAALKVLVTTADTGGGGASRVYAIEQAVEGNIYAFVAGKPLVVDFDVYSTQTGTYSLIAVDGANTACCVDTYTVNASNTYQHVTCQIPVPSGGSFPTNNTAGIKFRWVLASGTSSGQTSTIGSWQAAYWPGGASGQANALSAVNNVFEIANVNVTNGVVRQPFAVRPNPIEFQLCQRYYQLIQPTHFIGTSTTSMYTQMALPVIMRGTPTVSALAAFTVYTGSGTLTQSSAAVANTGSTTSLSYQGDSPNFTGVTVGSTYIRNNQAGFIALSAEIT